jgi:hypothetical protein
MAGKKKKNDSYEGALDSIWNVLFNAKSKKPGTLKPIKFAHKRDGTDALADAIGEIALAPAYYLSDSIAAGTTGPLEGVSLFSIKGAKGDRYGKAVDVELKVKIKDLPTLVSDPDALVDKMMKGLQDRTNKDLAFNLGRGMDSAVALFQAKKAGFGWREAGSFAMAAGSFTGLNADKAIDRNMVELAAYKSIGRLRDLPTDMKDDIAAKAWKAIDHGKMRSKYGHWWWEYADPGNSKYDPAVEVEFNRIMDSVGVPNNLRPDLLTSLSAESEHYAPTEANNRFYSYTDKDGEAPASIDGSPGFFRDTYARKHMERLKSLERDLLIERRRGPAADTAVVADLVSQIDREAAKAGTARFYQNVLGYHNNQADGSYDDSGKGKTSPDGRLSSQISDMEIQLNKLERFGVPAADLAGLRAEIADMQKRLAGVKGNFQPFNDYQQSKAVKGNPLLNPESYFGGPYSRNKMSNIAHRAGILAIDTEIKRLEFIQRSLTAGYTGVSDARRQSKLDSVRGRLEALRREKKDWNPNKYRVGVFSRQLSHLTHFIGVANSLKDGRFASNILSGEIFQDAIFGTGMMADPDADQGVTIFSLDINAAEAIGSKARYKNDNNSNMIFFLKNNSSRADWYADMTAANYFLPQNIIKTLFWDGSGFQYALYRKNLNFIRDMHAQVEGNRALKDAFTRFLGRKGVDLSKLSRAEFIRYMEKNMTEVLLDSGEPLLSGFEAQFRNRVLGGRLKGIVDFYSKYSPNALVTKFKNEVFKKFLMAKGVTPFLQNLLTLGGRITSKAWAGQVGQFLASKIGIQQLLTKGLAMLAEAIGIGTGPLGWVVMIVITLFGPAIVNKIIKPILSVVMTAISLTLRVIGLFLVGLVGLFAVVFIVDFGSAANGTISPLKAEGQSVMPEYTYPGDVGTPNTELPPVDIEGECPFTATWIDCTQGAHPASCTYDKNSCSHCSDSKSPIDLGTTAVFYANSDGNVTVSDPNPSGWCSVFAGGLLKFEGEVTNAQGGTEKIMYTFYHITPLVGVGPVTKGTALVQPDASIPVSQCWTGTHYHMYISKSGSGYYDPEAFLNKLCPGILDACGMGTECAN